MGHGVGSTLEGDTHMSGSRSDDPIDRPDMGIFNGESPGLAGTER